MDVVVRHVFLSFTLKCEHKLPLWYSKVPFPLQRGNNPPSSPSKRKAFSKAERRHRVPGWLLWLDYKERTPPPPLPFAPNQSRLFSSFAYIGGLSIAFGPFSVFPSVPPLTIVCVF